MLLQADNKILVSGTRPGSYGFIAVRFQTNGALDTSFGTNGKVIVLEGNFSVLYDSALQPDGKIILIGTVFSSSMPYRLRLKLSEAFLFIVTKSLLIEINKSKFVPKSLRCPKTI